MTTCAAPGCRRPVAAWSGRGRRLKYCSATCQRRTIHARQNRAKREWSNAKNVLVVTACPCDAFPIGAEFTRRSVECDLAYSLAVFPSGPMERGLLTGAGGEYVVIRGELVPAAFEYRG